MADFSEFGRGDFLGFLSQNDLNPLEGWQTKQQMMVQQETPPPPRCVLCTCTRFKTHTHARTQHAHRAEVLRELTLLLENAALAPEPCLSALLAVEAALCRHFSAASFAQLGVGRSLLTCLDDGGCPRLATTAQLLLHSHTTPAASLLLFAAACAAGLEAYDDAARCVVLCTCTI